MCWTNIYCACSMSIFLCRGRNGSNAEEKKILIFRKIKQIYSEFMAEQRCSDVSKKYKVGFTKISLNRMATNP